MLDVKGWGRFLLLLIFSSVSISAVAHNEHHSLSSLSLNQAWQKVIKNNPGLESAKLGVAATKGGMVQAAIMPNPSVSVMAENIAGSGPYNEVNAAESTLFLSQPIELGGKRFYRKQTARLKIITSVLLVHASRAQGFEATAEQFLTIAEAEAKLQLAHEAVSLSQQTMKIIQRRVTAGRSSSLELKSTQIELTDQQLLLKIAFQRWISARYALASLWGGQLNDVRHVTLKNFNAFKLTSLAQLMSHMQNNPKLNVLKKQEQVAQSEVALAKANGVPNVTAGVGIRHFNNTNDTAFIAEVSMPLPVFDRNQGNTASALAESSQSVENWLDQRNKLQKELFKTYQAAKQMTIQANILQKVIIPKAKQALVLSREGYTQGRYSYLELLSTQKKLLDEQLRYLTTLYRYRKEWIALQVLTGALPKQGGDL